MGSEMCIRDRDFSRFPEIPSKSYIFVVFLVPGPLPSNAHGRRDPFCSIYFSEWSIMVPEMAKYLPSQIPCDTGESWGGFEVDLGN